MNKPSPVPHPASFRDPSGFIYRKDGVLYRQVNFSYQENYQLLNQKLYPALQEAGLIINQEEISPVSQEAFRTLRPEEIPFISYPYEWSFSQLKDAALVTLEIQRLALRHGLSLKDASAYNIQFLAGKPVLIDTLSFEKYLENRPWIAYRQFCQHFLAPLALMAKVDLRLGSLSERYLDGIPLDLASSLLPKRTKLSLGLGAHLHLHARSQTKHAHAPSTSSKFALSKDRLLALLSNLSDVTGSLRLPSQQTTWGDYYEKTNYTSVARDSKQAIIERWLEKRQASTVWDAGANDGTFGRLAARRGIFTIATDIDPLAVESGYLKAKRDHDAHLLPLVIDLTNPSHAIGWRNQERQSFLERCQVDLTFCLAFIHHLAIANNLPLSQIADMFSQQTKELIIEFVPKEDSNTQRLLAAREDIFPGYTQKNFEQEFAKFFRIQDQAAVPESNRRLYLMKNLAFP